MTNGKTTKKALLASIMSMILCVSMLLGTTFAWFTDSVTSIDNIITAGNLDVSMHYADGTEEVPAKDSNDWADASTQAIFTYENWEPGYTDVRHIKIENEGSLALKYQVNIVAENGISNLANVIDVYFIDPATQVADRTALSDTYKVGTLTEVLGGMPANAMGTLKAEEFDTVTIALKMQESAGNEYQNQKFGAFSVQVLATQLDSELDSFGPDYDENAEYFEEVTDADGITNAIAEGKNIKFEADIALDETINISGDVKIDLNGFNMDASANTSRPFEVADGANLTIDGGDETITCGAYGLVNIPAGNDATVVINGGKFTAETNAGSFIKPRGDGEIKIVLNDVEYIDNSADGYALDCTGYTGDKLSVEINGGSFEAKTGMILPEGSSVKDAKITAKNTGNMQPAIYATGDMTIENCIIKADKSHAVAVSSGATLTVNNCEVYAGSDAGALAFQVFSSGGTININNTTFTGGYGTTGKMNSGKVAIINKDGTEIYRKG